MDSTVPADLLKLKARLEAWRATRKYARQPIPDEFRQAAADMAGRYSTSLVRRILKLDPLQLNKRTAKKPDRARHKPKTVSLRQNGVGTDFTSVDAILPKMFIRDAHHQERKIIELRPAGEWPTRVNSWHL
jgi:hypothetical protein